VFQLGNKLLEKSKKNFVSYHLTQPPIKKRLPTVMNINTIMNFQMDKLFKLTPQDSWVQKLFSSQTSLNKVMKLMDSTK